LTAIWNIKQRDIPDDEKRSEIEKILNGNGPGQITKFVLVHNDEVITLAKRPFRWFGGDDKDDKEEFLMQKLKEFDEQEQIDLEIRDRAILWNKMQSLL